VDACVAVPACVAPPTCASAGTRQASAGRRWTLAGMRRTTACVGALACRGEFAGAAVACEPCKRRVASGQQLHAGQVGQAFFKKKAGPLGWAQQAGRAQPSDCDLAPNVSRNRPNYKSTSSKTIAETMKFSNLSPYNSGSPRKREGFQTKPRATRS
jgi:hypothetical protein